MTTRRALVLLALLSGLGCGGGEHAVLQPRPALPSIATTPPTPYKTLHDQLKTDARKAGAVARKSGRSAIVHSRAAAAYMRLARISGDYEDLALAEEMLEAAFARPNSVAPYWLRAQLNFTLHRFGAAAQDLEEHRAQPRPPADPKALANEEVFAGQIAFELGNYAEASHHYDEARRLHPTPQAWSAMAHLSWKSADFEAADTAFDEALRLYGDVAGEPAAWLHLQRGLMALERGQFAEALDHYQTAEARLPGYWLIEEHIAEVLVLLGEPESARARYVQLVDETQKPEFMDALSELEELRGDTDAADELRERARTRYEALMEQFPEATYGHALRHYLAYGPTDKALEIAKLNHALRPNAEAKVLLAQAQLEVGDSQAATASVEEALATPIRTRELDSIAAIARAQKQ